MRSDKARLLSYTFVTHALVHGTVLSLPLFVPIWLAEFSVTRADIGFAMAVVFVFYGGMAIPAGILSDRHGADRFITGFLVLTGGALVTLHLADRFILLAMVLAGVGMGAGLYHAPALSLLSRQSYSSSRIFAYHNVGGHVGTGVGPLLVAVSLAFYNWRTVLLMIAAPVLAMGVLFHVTGPTDTANRTRASATHEEVVTQARRLFVAGFLFVLALYLLRGVYHRGTLTFLPDFLDLVSGLSAVTILGEDIPPGRWIYSLVLLIGAGGELVGGFLGERLDPEVVLTVLFVASAILLGIMGHLVGWPLFAVVGGLSLLLYTFPPILQHLVAEYSPATSRGLGYGFTSAGNIAIGGFIGSALAGWLATVGSYSFAFKALAIFPLIGIVLVVGFARRTAATVDTSVSE